jgi:UDP-glucose 4,6-dehydratase
MIVVLGASGYVGQAFMRALERKSVDCLPVSRNLCDYTDFAMLLSFLREVRPSFLINAAGFVGKPNVDACEAAQSETLQGNVLLPLTVSHVCQALKLPWGQISSGCIYSGAFLREGRDWRLIRDLSSPIVQAGIEQSADNLRGFTESDPPNFSWRAPPCSFYSGTKALAEEMLAKDPEVFVWRMRIPFNGIDNPRNYLTKLQRYAKVYDNINSLSHLDDMADACLALWNIRAPFGVYNVVNPGYVSTRQVVGEIKRHLRPDRPFEFWENDAEFYQQAASTPRSNCVLDATKLLSTGVPMRSVDEALTYALTNWQPSADHAKDSP